MEHDSQVVQYAARSLYQFSYPLSHSVNVFVLIVGILVRHLISRNSEQTSQVTFSNLPKNTATALLSGNNGKSLHGKEQSRN